MIGGGTREVEESLSSLATQIEQLPQTPGVYLMVGAHERVLYIGKAKNLRTRVRSYLAKTRSPKVHLLMSRVHRIDHISTESEYEALLLENNLIKRRSPPFNMTLKDGKTYPVIRITNEAYPRVFKTRQIVSDGSLYFGPFPVGKALNTYLMLIEKLFPLRKCRGRLKQRATPCLYHHIERCTAPCCGKISSEAYLALVEKIKSLLSGKTKTLEQTLEKQRRRASSTLLFERAAELRDLLKRIREMRSPQRVEDRDEEARDYLVFLSTKRRSLYILAKMREGRLVDLSFFPALFLDQKEEAITKFVIQYYGRSFRHTAPSSLYLEDDPPHELLTYLSHEEGRELSLRKAPSKRDLSILQMARENGEQELRRLLREQGDGREEGLSLLAESLSLPSPPHRIEGIDISHLQGRETVASLVSFTEGFPDKSSYRRFRLREQGIKIDDYLSMRELFKRRYVRVRKGDLKAPDLIVVDGGRGQVSSALSVLSSLGLRISLVGLAKRNEEIYLPGENAPRILPQGDPGLRILQEVRDEAHRFANRYHRTLRKSKQRLTTLEAIPGIGPARSKKLLLSFGSLKSICEASPSTIASTVGISFDLAKTIKPYLANLPTPQDRHGKTFS